MVQVLLTRIINNNAFVVVEMRWVRLVGRELMSKSQFAR